MTCAGLHETTHCWNSCFFLTLRVCIDGKAGKEDLCKCTLTKTMPWHDSEAISQSKQIINDTASLLNITQYSRTSGGGTA